MKVKSNDLIHKNTLSIYNGNGTISMCKLAAKDSFILIKGDVFCVDVQSNFSGQYNILIL